MDTDAETVDTWIEAELSNVIADMAAACARYQVVVTLTFVPPDTTDGGESGG